MSQSPLDSPMKKFLIALLALDLPLALAASTHRRSGTPAPHTPCPL